MIEVTKIEKGIKYSDKERAYFNSFRMYVSIDGKPYLIYGDARKAKSIVIEYFSKYMPHIKEECIDYIWTLVNRFLKGDCTTEVINKRIEKYLNINSLYGKVVCHSFDDVSITYDDEYATLNILVDRDKKYTFIINRFTFDNKNQLVKFIDFSLEHIPEFKRLRQEIFAYVDKTYEITNFIYDCIKYCNDNNGDSDNKSLQLVDEFNSLANKDMNYIYRDILKFEE